MLIIEKILWASALMFWEMLWALVLGFLISACVIVFVPKDKMSNALGGAGPKELALATALGAASSSCSYAAASMGRSLFQKGASITASLAFMLASTNLVFELSAVLWTMMGWQFVVAEFIGGVLMIGFMAVFMKLTGVSQKFEKHREIKSEAPEEDSHGSCCHGEDESGSEFEPSRLQEVASAFWSEWGMLWRDIALGLLISGVLMVLVPDSFWASLFMGRGSQAAGAGAVWKAIENALVGPWVSVFSFVCSIGNIPLASVLYHGGISMGGVVSFIYADLIIIPLILIYRRYYGWRLALWMFGIFYFSMASAGLVVEGLFSWLGWVPQAFNGTMAHSEMGISMNYTFWLNAAFSLIAVALFLVERHRRHVEGQIR